MSHGGMANNLNTITLSGNLTRDPELRSTNSGKAVVSLRVANNRFQRTNFLDVTAWEGLAELIAKVYSKGDNITVVGEVQTREYTDKEGNDRTAFEIVARDVQLPPKGAGDLTSDDIDF